MRSRSSIAGFVAIPAFSLAVAFAGCGGGGGKSTLPSTTLQQTASQTASAAGQIRSIQSFAPPPSAGTPLFLDDFANGSTAGWTTQLGSSWSICQPPGAAREYCTPGNARGLDALSTAGSAVWTRYEVDTWVVPGSASEGGVELVARFLDTHHYYQLELRNLRGAQIWAINKYKPGAWTTLASGPVTYLAGSPYHLRLVLDGPSITAYATTIPNDLTSEKKLGSVTDSDYPSGSIGVRAIAGIPARFYNVGVYNLASPTPVPSQPPAANPALTVPSGFYIQVIAQVSGARELAAASNGDLLVGTRSASVMVVPNAESDGVAGAARMLITLPEPAAQGIALGPNGSLYVGTATGVWRVPYTPGTLVAPAATKIAAIRTGPVAPHSDGDVHYTTSLIVSGTTLYVGVGSSCNACTEVDPTRASVQAMNLDGSGMHTFATRIRNPIAFAVDPATGSVFTGGAGQDNLPEYHPYEYVDLLTSHAPVADYGWPECEENHHAYTAGSNCTNTVQPSIEFPAYSTIESAAFSSATASGTYAFPAAFRGGIFVSMHGSWHAIGGIPIDKPHVAFVPMNGDQPAKPVNWSDPTAQWVDFLGGFQSADGSRIGESTGVAVGSRGSLFVADGAGSIYRIRPGVTP